MTMLFRFFSFLAGIKFAICLIGMLALYVIFGTFIESSSQSHRYAASLSYHHPFFILLLIGFFVNILFSALKRYPYKAIHIPFLVTHLGLLMIIMGTMIKGVFGLQGSMEIYEGSEKNEVLIPDIKSLYIEKRIPNPGYASSSISTSIPINSNFKLSSSSTIQELDFSILEYRPHAIPQYNAWVKGKFAYIQGLEPIPLINQTDFQKIKNEGLSFEILSKKVRFFPEDMPWNLFAFQIDGKDYSYLIEQLKKLSVNSPLLSIIKTEDKEYLVKFDRTGEIQQEIFHQQFEKLKSIVMYDQGFDGYAVASTIPFRPQNDESSINSEKPLYLECPLTCAFNIQEPSKKLEENLPVLTLKIQLKNSPHQKQIQNISLGYDPNGSKLKWPILNGQYLLRFQPLSKKIPYDVRVRDARQVPYPQTNQTYSFECDLMIRKNETQKNDDVSLKNYTETTLSMNRVYETWDGYRFYLANIAPLDEIDVQRVILIVNYDPAKYILTYPGAILVGLGIILLFWLRPYKTRK